MDYNPVSVEYNRMDENLVGKRAFVKEKLEEKFELNNVIFGDSSNSKLKRDLPHSVAFNHSSTSAFSNLGTNFGGSQYLTFRDPHGSLISARNIASDTMLRNGEAACYGGLNVAGRGKEDRMTYNTDLNNNNHASKMLPGEHFDALYNNGDVENRLVITAEEDRLSYKVQTNVADYYETLFSQTVEHKETFRCSDHDTTGLRKGGRSKSSELPLSNNVALSYGLSKSWGSTSKTRNEFKESGLQSERVAEMFRHEEDLYTSRAIVFQEKRVLRKVFSAWFKRTRNGKVLAEELCRKHLLRKGMTALKRTPEYQRQVLSEFHAQQSKITLSNCWIVWHNHTSEKQRVRMQNTFTQWHYYKLHLEREKLLDTMVRRHILSKKYSKWKDHFNAKQKNSIASLHFKINLVHQYWLRWSLYTKQRRVKNHLNCIARCHYAEHRQRQLLEEWRERTQKSQLCRKIARRCVLFKTFFQWKHWTQYAKIVRLRSHNMCKQYHRKRLMKRSLQHWRQALHVKRSLEFLKMNQLRRSLKLWKLRFMRKKLHKHLCRALAKKAKKRRFFQKWIYFIQLQNQERFAFVKAIEMFQFRVVFRRWHSWTAIRTSVNESVSVFQIEQTKRGLKSAWEVWKFRLKVIHMRKHQQNNWSLRCVRRCCKVWKLKIRKKNLVIKLNDNRSVWRTLIVRRFFHVWQSEIEKSKYLYSRSLCVAGILKKNSLARVFQAWRVVNQEECIIHDITRRRERKNMAVIYDAWRRYVSRVKIAKVQVHLRVKVVRRNAFEHWRYSLRLIVKEQEAQLSLRNSKLQRHFIAWLELAKDLRLVEAMRSRKKAIMTRKFVDKWKIFAEEKMEKREKEDVEKAYRRILLVSFFTVWRDKAHGQVQRSKHMENVAKLTYEEHRTTEAFRRWCRQYTIERKTREYLAMKKVEQLREMFLSWRDFVNDELEQQVNDFAANLILDSSLTTSGYHTSLKNSTTSFNLTPRDIENFQCIDSPRSRPITPTRSSDDSSDKSSKQLATLPSFRPVTTERQNHISGYQTPPGFHGLLQYSSDQLSQTASSHQHSSEDDGVPSSGVHSAGEESDQEDTSTSINVADSVCSFPTMSEDIPRDRELLVADTILHWRSLSLSVAFRSWYKFTKRMTLLRELYGACLVSNRENLLKEMLRNWRRWLHVTVLARQQLFNMMKQKHFSAWVRYRSVELLKERNKQEAVLFRKTHLNKHFFTKWKSKKSSKTQIQSILGKWQRTAAVTDTDKVVISQFQRKDEAISLKQAFLYWKKATRNHQEASVFCKNLLLHRYFCGWKSVASFQAGLGKKVTKFRNVHLMSKTFQEWRLRYKDNRTAKILIGVSDERRIVKIFKAWHEWATTVSLQSKASLIFHGLREQEKLKAKFHLWSIEAKKRVVTREHYKKSLQRKILRCWRNVFTVKANISATAQDFQELVKGNKLRVWFGFWRKRTQDCQLLSQHLKQNADLRLRHAFQLWRHERRHRVAVAHFARKLKKKTFKTWYQEIVRRKKARQHFKTWHTIAEGSKERNHIADNIIHASEVKLLTTSFGFWKQYTRHLQVAGYHHSKKISRRFFLVWREYSCKRRQLNSSLTQFHSTHHKNNLGLLEKYMKLWKIKSTCSSTKADEIYHQKVSAKYWEMWRHTFVRHKVSSAMVDHDNKKILSRVFMCWYQVTSSHKRLKSEVEMFRTRLLFRKWMSRYNDS